MTNQLPPSDLEAERAVVAACLLSPEALGKTRDILQPAQLFDATCRFVLEATYALDDAGTNIDMVTLGTSMRGSGRLNDIGGTAALMVLFDASPDLTHVEDHARIVVDKARLRRIIDVCRTHQATAHGDVGDVGEYCAKVERDILDATDCSTRDDAPQTIGEILPHVMPAIMARQDPNAKQIASGVKTGMFELDSLLGGGFDPALYVVGARPGQGKSAFAMTLCLNIARAGKAAVFYSAEMPKEQLALRCLACESLVPYNELRSRQLDREKLNQVLNAQESLSRLPLSIQFRPGAHMSQVRSTMRREFARLRRTHGVDPGIGAIDYFQILTGDRPRGASREEEIASISRRAMQLPSEFGCPILGLSQLNRGVENRPNKRPNLSDLRESGAIEQDAYGVLFLYRDEYYNDNSEKKGIAEVIVGKARNGETGSTELKFNGPCTRFSSMRDDLCEEVDEFLGGY